MHYLCGVFLGTQTFYLLDCCSNCDLEIEKRAKSIQIVACVLSQASHIEWMVVADLSSVW